jgi:rhodanese-related sulfurtransferase
MRAFLKFFLLVSVAILMGSFTAYAETQAISAVEANRLLSGQKAVIVDVREESEWNEQHIPGAIHIPLGQLNERLAELKEYKDSPVIAQCRSGKRSAKAADVLTSAGFSKVYNMEGGILAWDKAGLKTE